MPTSEGGHAVRRAGVGQDHHGVGVAAADERVATWWVVGIGIVLRWRLYCLCVRFASVGLIVAG